MAHSRTESVYKMGKLQIDTIPASSSAVLKASVSCHVREGDETRMVETTERKYNLPTANTTKDNVINFFLNDVIVNAI